MSEIIPKIFQLSVNISMSFKTHMMLCLETQVYLSWQKLKNEDFVPFCHNQQVFHFYQPSFSANRHSGHSFFLLQNYRMKFYSASCLDFKHGSENITITW